ncbi:hypothetical protein [Corynebacterium liangguodongii]|uniref:Uncharacterized protein n=1 Tax=Corynebacterium liangguodongii TaxID=2079535 RepID=A0A2S0WDG4_9CORY|nr:hypothetical protein [Corynebacterium liangguodongii]AWB83801.1 hypothetical protein C3E79_04300 [Corynebacterium liangguodongii]PWB98922.1 hypothetical protein DF219_08990 [Corynebacterium liangguodongii]
MLTRPGFTTTAAVALCAAAVCALGACGRPAETAAEGYIIGIKPDSVEQEVLGEIYRALLVSVGQPATVERLPAAAGTTAVDLVGTGEADVAIACTGEILGQLNPALAEETQRDIEEDETAGDMNDDSASKAVYEDAVGTFPGGVMTIDPSPAEGCAEKGAQRGEGTLPMNIIPVFRKTELNRGQVNRLNFVNRVISTDDLDAMVGEVEGGAPVRRVVASWMLEHTKVGVDPQSIEEGESGASDKLLDQPPV